MSDHEARHQAVRERLSRVRDRIATAAARSGRGAEAVRIVGVTKGHPHGVVDAALAAGLRHLGENRVEELARKSPHFEGRGIVWHMIGHVQGRKAAGAARHAALIHSVDSLRLAGRLSRRGEAEERRIAVLVQVNASGEATKGGFPEAEALDAIGRLAALPGLRVQGMMTMAPFTTDERTLRDTFRRTRLVRDAAVGIDGVEGRELSMGMSNDFEIAIEEGSTMVRLGTTLFGRRRA